jgi:formylglycine-generating enzyme required for sulfatase activity
MIDCKGCNMEGHNDARPMEAASLKPNPFGLLSMGGSVAQWVSDCWHKDYRGAPKDGSSWEEAFCRQRVLKGGSWKSGWSDVRPASRNFYDPDVRYVAHGFRVASDN